MTQERRVRPFLFNLVWRRWRYPQRLYRCVICRAATDDPQGHAEWHEFGQAIRPPNPSVGDGTISVDVDLSAMTTIRQSDHPGVECGNAHPGVPHLAPRPPRADPSR